MPTMFSSFLSEVRRKRPQCVRSDVVSLRWTLFAPPGSGSEREANLQWSIRQPPGEREKHRIKRIYGRLYKIEQRASMGIPNLPEVRRERATLAGSRAGPGSIPHLAVFLI